MPSHPGPPPVPGAWIQRNPARPPRPVPLHRLSRRWPVPTAAPGPVVLGAAAVAGLVVAVCVPLDGPGVGWLVGGLAAAAAVLRSRPAADRPDAVRAAWAVATVLLLGVGTLRAADWLFALCLLAAAGTGALALTRGSGAAAVAVRIAALPAGAVRAPRWAAAGLVAAGRPRTGASPRSGWP